ncbi:MAG: hypothetical protein HY852_10410 [Bradyrhizobium sp.]|uniref:hypothetical protein n=1 Tax=Bradyrhizobium sp. TaxID=376 RepID=UPI0025C6BC79|nr:hypothetical protein [Bradyrhizobium sp.]MBI5262212.1 hypothetical protein [Bradyrhizobium sp.]
MLGDLLASLTDETTAVETILGAGDLALLTAVREQAAAAGVELAAYVSQTVRHYANEATDEEWITLMGAINRSPDPGATCLKRAFEYVLQQH